MTFLGYLLFAVAILLFAVGIIWLAASAWEDKEEK